MRAFFSRPVEPRRYFLVAVTTAAALLAVISAVGVWSVFFDVSFGFQVLYQHQLRKIADVRDADTVLLGDSSLGNAVDAAQFSRLTGTRAVSLALTGSYGHAGSYNLLKRLDGRPVKNVVVMCTLDTMNRDVSYAGYLLTLAGTKDVLELPAAERVELVAAFYDQILSVRKFKTALRNLLGLGRQQFFIESDYIRQGRPVDPSRTAPMQKSRIIRDKLRFLVRIRDYCAARDINLIYVHGPIYEGVGRASADYTAEVNRLIGGTGVKLVPDLAFISREEVGDSADHVAPPFKAKFTAHYAELLKPHLRAGPAPAR